MNIKIKKYLVLPLILLNLSSCSDDNIFFFCDYNEKCLYPCISDTEIAGEEVNAIKFIKKDKNKNSDTYNVDIFIANLDYYQNGKKSFYPDYRDIEISMYNKETNESYKKYIVNPDEFNKFENCIIYKNKNAYIENSITESDFNMKFSFNLLEFFKEDVDKNLVFIISYKNSSNISSLFYERRFEIEFIFNNGIKEIKKFSKDMIFKI